MGEARAMFQVNRNTPSFCIYPANRDEKLSSCLQFNLSSTLPYLLLPEKVAHLHVSLYSSAPLLPKVSNGEAPAASLCTLLSLSQRTVDFACQNPILENCMSLKSEAKDLLS